MEFNKENIEALQHKLINLSNWIEMKNLVAHENFNVRIEVSTGSRIWDTDRVSFDLDGIGVPREFAEAVISEKVRLLTEELREMMR